MKGRALSILLGLVYLQAVSQSNLDVTSKNILNTNQDFVENNLYHTMFRIDKDDNRLIWYNEYYERSGDPI